MSPKDIAKEIKKKCFMANHCHEVSLLEGRLRMRKWRSGTRSSQRAHAPHSLAAIKEQPHMLTWQHVVDIVMRCSHQRFLTPTLILMV